MNFHRNLYFDWLTDDGGYIFSESFENVENFDALHFQVDFCFENGYCETIEEVWVYDPLMDEILETYTVPEPNLAFSLVIGFVLTVAAHKKKTPDPQ